MGARARRCLRPEPKRGRARRNLHPRPRSRARRNLRPSPGNLRCLPYLLFAIFIPLIWVSLFMVPNKSQVFALSLFAMCKHKLFTVLKDFQTGRLERAGTGPVRKSLALARPSRARAWPGLLPCPCPGRGSTARARPA